ncbi:hypothetical protein SAMN04488700_1268 [Carnobacterium iners]|uniref:Haloacid dehalogenase-like hydrolase n=1 Tax=Carnobacterium iners TaxID=1073423 RepID=A0A1X7N2K6_9LACT|nr:Cof-type HAD-IIB family hydrolase [Carnobacterium iners]SEL19450.1 hypothetical protein SAMN04488114_13410 [Carnobacterium iners]SMH31494.1 hypothetical protein SAMN04488700_1268 [Carnobacterium iners]
MIKLIASDMDGTLLNEKMVISDINAKAILAAQKKGIHFMIATGRGYSEAKPLIEEVGISCPLITLNGAQVYNEKGEIIENIGLSKETVKAILEKTKALGLYCEMTTSLGVYSDNKAKRIEAVASLIYRTNPDTSFKMAVVLAAARLEIMNINYVTDYKELIDDDSIEILKIIVFSGAGPKVLQPLAEDLKETGDLAITASFVNNIEINHVKAQKGLALVRAAQALDIHTDDIMALGDNYNDVSMLKVAGYSVAVENAEEGVKAHAKYLTSTNSENGVAESILLALNDEMAKQLAQ